MVLQYTYFPTKFLIGNYFSVHNVYVRKFRHFYILFSNIFPPHPLKRQSVRNISKTPLLFIVHLLNYLLPLAVDFEISSLSGTGTATIRVKPKAVNTEQTLKEQVLKVVVQGVERVLLADVNFVW